MTAVSPKRLTLTLWMVAAVGLKSGSLMSERNLVLALTSPSYSVLTKRSATRASNDAESRLTWASFQRRSTTTRLLSRGSDCAAACPDHPSTNKIWQTFRIIFLRARHIPAGGGRSEKITVLIR